MTTDFTIEPTQSLTYDQWCDALVAHARSLQEEDEQPILTMDDLGGKDCDSWISYWQDGVSPADAYREDCSYG